MPERAARARPSINLLATGRRVADLRVNVNWESASETTLIRQRTRLICVLPGTTCDCSTTVGTTGCVNNGAGAPSRAVQLLGVRR